MTQLLKTLGRTALFRGLSEEEAEKALSCLGTQRRCYAKGEAVLRAGDHVGSVALVLSGSVCIENNDAWGVWGRGRCLPRLMPVFPVSR